MESNKIAILEKQLPLRAYPEKELDKVLETSFKFWLANLLSIKAENEEKLDNALPAIKKHFWSLGIHEIKKAFEMYADSELISKPVPNYFDRILVGNIFKEYKAQKKVVKKEIDHQEIMRQTNKSHLVSFFNQYFKTKQINDCYVVFAYDSLEKNGFIKLTKQEKLKLMKDSEVLFIIDKKENGNIKEKLKEYKKEDVPEDELIFLSKKIALKDFLRKLNNDNIEKIKTFYGI